MPPKKLSTSRRQPSVDLTGLSSDPGVDSDADVDFDPVLAATELKKVIDEHKKHRFAARKKIEKKYQTKVAEIVKRTEARMAERDMAKARTRQEQMGRLVAAMEARDVKQRTVADKVGRFYNSCMNLTSVLQMVYSGLAEDAQKAVLDDGTMEIDTIQD
ncbi:uncharacterized protein SPSK_05594 [Sporothrix schenckii 1099-18]|uniref:Uncharacterized protein n=2 Tax=Sporothrix schenckii TaxID=29908 RepID=U7Q559_SPOS1|nr:uncharacterized protein SPSK_05594 [Sporothrix schenckii 1099-18]ERT02160.1 hypothetical protein HMPREF1624_00458 [Sporothrix schenckii ATCC 58251]KJR80627.1 hypothetical protein SPSK_05594 [Sporothrix schenckii 1099-18]